MKYNQSKKIALDKNQRMGIRYLRLLRCITHVCRLNNEKFQIKLYNLDTGFKTEEDSEKASLKIIQAIEKLDYDIKDTPKNDTDRQFIKAHETTKAPHNTESKIKQNSCEREYKILKWQVSLKIKKIDPKHVKITTKQAIDKFEKEYLMMTPQMEDVSKALYLLLERKLNYVSAILAFHPQIRVKSWQSVLEKIVRINYNPESLTEMQDLIGLRVVTIFEKDLPTIERVIEKTFKVVRKYKPNYINNGGINSLTHIIIKSPTKSAYIKNENIELNFLAEIQIMTLSQFTFARASHALLYKSRLAGTKAIESSLKRVSALLDSVDLELSRNFIKDERE